MSHVYRAVDTAIGRQVAVKILTNTASEDEEAKASDSSPKPVLGG